MISPKKNSQNSGTGWGGVADWYDEHLQSGNSYHETLVWPKLLNLLGDINNKKVLDLACGTGFFTHKIAELGAKVTGVDISPELIEKAKFGSSKAKFIVAPVNDLSVLDNEEFDHIINILAIDNIAEVEDMHRECARILHKDGAMHLVFNHPAFRNPSQSSWGMDSRKHIQYRRIDKYMSESRVKIAMHPGANDQTTTTFHRPLEWYFKQFEGAGFRVSKLQEWVSNRESEPGPKKTIEDRARSEFPLFIYIQLTKSA